MITEQTTKKYKIIAVPADAWACGLYRIIAPFYKLSAQEHKNLKFDLYDHDNLSKVTIVSLTEQLMQYDAVVFQRVGTNQLLGIMQVLKANGKKVYMDIDDDLLNVAKTSPAYSVWHPESEHLIYFKSALRMCDAVFVSTPELMETYKEYNPRFNCFWNGIDVSDPKFCEENSRKKELEEDKTYVMWTGSSTHLDSLHVVCKELRTLFNPRPNAVFSLCSNEQFIKLFNIRKEQKLYVPHVPIHKYFNIPSMSDIGLAPVVLNEFNRAKSELKCLEYGMWGVPTVCTDIEAYRRFNEVSKGGNLLVEKNSPRQWNEKVASLIDDKEMRKELGAKAKATVFEHYDVNKINLQRLDFFKKEFNIVE